MQHIATPITHDSPYCTVAPVSVTRDATNKVVHVVLRVTSDQPNGYWEASVHLADGSADSGFGPNNGPHHSPGTLGPNGSGEVSFDMSDGSYLQVPAGPATVYFKTDEPQLAQCETQLDIPPRT